MPAPAVIPALIAYVKVVAVKTLVVGFRSSETSAESSGLRPPGRAGRLATVGGGLLGCELYLRIDRGATLSGGVPRLAAPGTITKLV